MPFTFPRRILHIYIGDVFRMRCAHIPHLAKRTWQLIKFCCNFIAKFCASTDASCVCFGHVSCTLWTHIVCEVLCLHGCILCVFWTWLSCILDMSCACSGRDLHVFWTCLARVLDVCEHYPETEQYCIANKLHNNFCEKFHRQWFCLNS